MANAVILITLAGMGACVGQVLEPGGSDGPPVRPPGTVGPVTADFASESGARRLTNHELDNTVRDLLGDDRAIASTMLLADQFAPFDNDYTVQMASEALITSLEIYATDVAGYVMADTALRDALVPCAPTGPGDTACFRAFIEDFAPRAFRRPITEEEITAYMALQEYSIEDIAEVDNDFYTGIDLVIRAVLQDPEFLYRIEVGSPTSRDGVFALDAYEIATRLSYFLWATTPDPTLLGEAASGALLEPEGRRAAAARMLADERARVQLRRFHTMWLGYRVLPHDTAMVNDFSMETGALIDRVVFDEPQSYLNLFTFEETYVNDALATHYGLPAPAGGEGWVPYGDTGRAGILSHGSLLSAFAKFADTSPTQRGILIRTRLMCQEIQPPPPTIDVDDEPVGESPDDCKFERYSAHRDLPGCVGCHNQMDPIGFGLENYDMAGRFREHDEGRPECVIAGDGNLPDGTAFNGPAELAGVLLDAGYIDACAMQQLYSFAIGRPATGVEEEAVEELVGQFGTSGHDLSGLIADFVASDRFAHRREEAL
jgi:hypothetical protein